MNLFYEHLDGCSQCRNNPFDLCREGQRLLLEVSLVLSSRGVPRSLLVIGAKS